MKVPSDAEGALLVPYRAVGLVTDGNPFAVVEHGTETFLTVGIGRSYQIFNCNKLRQVFVGEQLKRSVTALCAHASLTIVGSGAAVHVFRRSDLVVTCEGEHTASLRHMLTIGDTLVTVCAEGLVVAWSLPSGEVSSRMHAGFAPTALAHPATYLNKIVLGAPDGRMQLWNMRSQAKVYEFAGWGSAVLALAQSPALDVMGVGLADGRVLLHNLKTDTCLLSFAHDAGDAVRCLAFRSDQQPWLVSCSEKGHLHVWHLEKRERLASVHGAHEGAIAAAHFVRGTSELLTGGAADNALRSWVFDRPDGGGRLLRARAGHAAPPSTVIFHRDSVMVGGGPSGQAMMITSGADRTVRLASLWSAQQDAELSQRREEKKRRNEAAPLQRRLPAVLDLCSSQVRETDWANVLSCHVESSCAYTWDTSRKALAPHVLRPSAPSTVTAVCISPCGNFGYLGSQSGALDKFNLQSGQRRATCPLAARHDGPVRGLAADALGKTLLSGGQDGTLRVWKAHALAPERRVEAGAPVTTLKHPHDSALVGLSCDDLTLRVFDALTLKLVRQFGGHTNTVTDFAWSADARWLLSVSLDATLRICDVPSGQLVGRYLLPCPATSIAVSPGGEFVATTHADTNAVCVWANRAFFSSCLVSAVAASSLVPLPMPTAWGAGDDGEESEPDDSSDDEDEDDEVVAEVDADAAAAAAADVPTLASRDEQLHDGLFTLSRLPTAHSKTLANLDVIRKRNRPTEPVKAPLSAPFFLPTLPGVERTFVPEAPAAAAAQRELDAAGFGGGGGDDEDWPDEGEDEGEEEGGGAAAAAAPAKKPRSRLLNSQSRAELSPQSRLAALLCAAERAMLEHGAAGFGEVLEHLHALSPSALDLELRALSADDGGTELRLMLTFLRAMLEGRRDLELVQATLSALLKIHATTLAAQPALLAPLRALHAAQQAGWGELQTLLHTDLCLLSHLCRTQS